MKDPVIDPADWTAFERELLDAAMRDQIPPELKARMAEGVVGSLAAGSAAVGGGATAPVGGLLFSKTIAIGVASVLLVGGAVGWQVLRGHSARPAEPELQAELRAPGQAVSPQPSAANAHPAPVTADAVPAADGATLPGVRGVALREEIALLDACRRAVKDRASARALHLLSRYDARFPAGALAPEAAALRIEALVQSGATPRARALAQEFLTTYPASPLAQRIEQLTGMARPTR